MDRYEERRQRRVRPSTKRKILRQRRADPGRSWTRNFHLTALQTTPDGIDALAERILAWTKGLADELDAELWLRADIVPVKETMNEDGTTEVKLRQIALLETPMKLDQADHLVTLLQKQQVGVQSDWRG